jgi:hypothetical protein
MATLKMKCDLIVGWQHNWPECPKELEVVELRRVLRGVAVIARDRKS